MKSQSELSAEAKASKFKKFLTTVSKLIERDTLWKDTAYDASNVEDFTKIRNKIKGFTLTMGDPKQYYVNVNFGEGVITSYGINENINNYIFAKAIEQAAKLHGIKLNKQGTEFYRKWKVQD